MHAERVINVNPSATSQRLKEFFSSAFQRLLPTILSRKVLSHLKTWQIVTHKWLVFHKEGNQKQDEKWRVNKNICESAESLKEGAFYFANAYQFFQLIISKVL